ncbi:MAG: sulfurtransferase [Anaerolineae bacterium]|nr:sulfurtransferase [Anaerolineae bacterium]
MPYTTLISTGELSQHLADPDWAVVDCRFSLDDTAQGRRDYQQAHIPGAVYAHLDEDLSGPIIPGQTGRHPLPDLVTVTRTLSNWGIDDRVQVVVYDGGNSSMAARLWAMLRWLGHPAVAVLDGGWSAWQSEGRPARSGVEARSPRRFTPRPRPELVLDAPEVDAIRTNPAWRLFDSRSGESYRGEKPGYDPIAGHIPGALSAPYADNLDPKGRFLPLEQLRARFQALLGDVPAEQAVFYCGSGVTAAHNLLALAHAGLGEARLYVGSWSDWITDPTRPISNPSDPSSKP